jgi:hypothetical protein
MQSIRRARMRATLAQDALARAHRLAEHSEMRNINIHGADF